MTRPAAELVRAYQTRFREVEEPLSENGMWLNGKSDGIDWTDVLSRGGVAYGAVSRMGVSERRVEQGNTDPDSSSTPIGDYDDPTAILAGSWGSDQRAWADVFSQNQTDAFFQEVQIRLRSSMSAHQCAGYEVIWRCLANENSYVEIVRWNGNVGDFTSLARRQGLACAISDGETVAATIYGDRITAFINDVEILSATDGAFADGAPGIGFNFGVGNTNVDHGLRSFDVETYDQ